MAKYTIALCFNRILEWVKDFWNLFVRQKSRKIFRSLGQKECSKTDNFRRTPRRKFCATL